jgi:hypothetical protein
MEQWADVFGLEGKYQVSDYGNVKSLGHEVNNGNGTRIVTGRILKFNIHKKGYLYVHAGKKGTVHRLVAFAFVPNPKNLPEINHIDTDKTNNKATNLEWTDRLGNIIHSLKTVGRKFKSHYAVNNEQVQEIKNSTDSKKIICHKYNISRSTVYLIQKSVQN